MMYSGDTLYLRGIQGHTFTLCNEILSFFSSTAPRITPFKTPYSVSPTSSISSQDSSRSRQGSTARRSRRKNRQESVRKESSSQNTDSAEKTLVDSPVPPSHSRTRHSSGSTTRSQPSDNEQHSDSGEPRLNGAGSRQESSITENGDTSNISRVPPPQGEALEEDTEASDKDTVQSERSVSDRVPGIDPAGTPRDSADALEPQRDRSTRSESSVSGSRRKRRKRSNLLTFPKKSGKRGTTQTPDVNRSGTLGRDSSTIVVEDHPAEGSVPRNMSRTQLPESPSSTSNQKRSRSSRKKRQAMLTFRKKGRSPRPGSKEGTSPRVARSQSSSASDKELSDSMSSSQQSTARRKLSEAQSQSQSRVKGQPSKAAEDAALARKKASRAKGASRETPRTPGNKSMVILFIFVFVFDVDRSKGLHERNGKAFLKSAKLFIFFL